MILPPRDRCHRLNVVTDQAFVDALAWEEYGEIRDLLEYKALLGMLCPVAPIRNKRARDQKTAAMKWLTG